MDLREREGHGSDGAPSGQLQIHDEAFVKEERAIMCAACGHAVTRERARIAVSGAHAHEFKNPAGVDYRIGCFAEAPGCAGYGERSSVWTWFPGFSWQVAECARCGALLGWSFAGDASSFWGLILDRLA